MGNNILELKTNTELLEALKRVAGVKLTPTQILEQRASFVMGSMSSESSVTKEHIRQVIAEQEGINIE